MSHRPALIDTVAESFGGLDILVCNAGVAMAGLKSMALKPRSMR